MSDLISVVIPAYNVEPYLTKCVQSVINQSYRDLEIIIVDDGSTDRTGIICDELRDIDSRIKVIHQSNQGLSVARNVGIEASSGHWITFLDSDDWIEKDMYNCLHEIAIQQNADIASCKTRNCILGKEPPVVEDSEEIIVLDSDHMIRGLLDQKVVRFEVWNKLWRRALIGETRFKPGQVSEDVYFDRVLFLRANKMVHIEKTFHNYLIQRPGNTLSSFKKARLCVFEEFDALIQDLKIRHYDEAVDIVNCIATAFSVTIYEQASKSKQSKEIKEQLKAYQRKYYTASKGSKNRSKRGDFGMRLFLIHPALFYIIWHHLGRD